MSLGAMPLGYALGPILGDAFGPVWPLAGAAVLVVITMSAPAFVPEVRNMRLRGPAEDAVTARDAEPALT
jgi:hypothetical protein